MTNRVFAAAAAVVLVAVLGVQFAYADVETVVVTAERRDSGAPHIVMIKRADHLISTVRVTCDTRDLNQRNEELKATLRNMIHAASSTKSISLGTGEDVIVDLNDTNFDDIIVPDSRADTSQALVVIKASVSAEDTFNEAAARIKDFIEKTPKVGRTEILREDRWNLTLVGPEQYRDQLISQITQDAKHTSEMFGPGYGIEIEGLEHRVEWFQKGP